MKFSQSTNLWALSAFVTTLASNAEFLSTTSETEATYIECPNSLLSINKDYVLTNTYNAADLDDPNDPFLYTCESIQFFENRVYTVDDVSLNKFTNLKQFTLTLPNKVLVEGSNQFSCIRNEATGVYDNNEEGSDATVSNVPIYCIHITLNAFYFQQGLEHVKFERTNFRNGELEAQLPAQLQKLEVINTNLKEIKSKVTANLKAIHLADNLNIPVEDLNGIFTAQMTGLTDVLLQQGLDAASLIATGIENVAGSLENLSLTGNGFKQIPTVIFDLVSLRSLDISMNPYTADIDAGVDVGLNQLEKLNFKCLDDSIVFPTHFLSQLDNLKELILDNCNFGDVYSNDEMIARIPINENMVSLSIQNNNLLKIPVKFLRKFPNLKKLDLTNNILEDMLETDLQGNEALEEIILKGNRLHQIVNGVFSPLQNLKILDLTHNSIRVIQEFAIVDKEITLDFPVLLTENRQLDCCTLGGLGNVRDGSENLDFGINMQCIDYNGNIVNWDNRLSPLIVGQCEDCGANCDNIDACYERKCVCDVENQQNCNECVNLYTPDPAVNPKQDEYCIDYLSFSDVENPCVSEKFVCRSCAKNSYFNDQVCVACNMPEFCAAAATFEATPGTGVMTSQCYLESKNITCASCIEGFNLVDNTCVQVENSSAVKTTTIVLATVIPIVCILIICAIALGFYFYRRNKNKKLINGMKPEDYVSNLTGTSSVEIYAENFEKPVN